MITVAKALGILRATCRPNGSEEVPLSEGVGRVLAREIVADLDWPPFDTSAMDGYAVRLEDVPTSGFSLPERPGLLAAGDPTPPPLRPGEAVRVMTGAPLPPGTEAIIPVEQTVRKEGRVQLNLAPAPGAHIRRRGESVAAGTRLLSEGHRLSSAEVALAALCGADPLPVYRRPRISIAVTGNEVVAPRERPGPGLLRDSNGPLLLSLCRARGWPAKERARIADDEASVKKLFARAGQEEDLLLTTGGVSAGDLDLLPGAAEHEGFEILFQGVAVRPGKPIALGRRGETLWIGLPGNPVSASVGFHLFARYAADLLEGAASPGPPFVTARLYGELSGTARETYQDGRLSSEGGENHVEPLPSAGSHDLATHARANALIRIPANCGRIAAGEIVTCLLL